MLQVGKIKLRDIKELQGDDVGTPRTVFTPMRKRKNLKSATTNKKLNNEVRDNETVIDSKIAITTTITKTVKKRLLKSALKETPTNQKRIDSYFTSCPKNYDIKLPKEEQPTPFAKSKTQTKKTKTKGSRSTSSTKNTQKSPARPRARRKRLFTDSTEPSTENMSDTSYMQIHKNQNNNECITIDSDSEEENNVKKEFHCSNDKTVMYKKVSEPASTSKSVQPDKSDCKSSLKNSSPITASSLSFGQRMTNTSCENTKSISKSSNVSGSVSRRKTKPCPPYKIIENTTFAVDAFQFGYIENVSHYFLTHFHADHYIGLTKSFSMPLFVSPITARLLRAFIPVQEQYIHELELNQSYVINNIEITALDANHCPGSIMFVFKFLETKKCILHTGDFRACHDMESEPIFWNNDIHTIYLDTTYISDKYAFCTQYESIEKAHELIDKFLVKHCWQRVLFVCGSYIIGKEKFWSSLAEELNMKVWTEGNRYKALKAINDEHFNSLLVEDPTKANMHILPMGKLTYLELVEYFKLYEDKYDVLFAIRPSGWEKDTKPRYGSKINLVGVEYSEHSSYAEMQRFVKFIKPEKVISTVPTNGRDLMKTAIVPHNWYNYDKLKTSNSYQPSIDSFLGKTPHKKLTIRFPNANKGGVEHFVSPLKLTTPNKQNEMNNNTQTDKAISNTSSQLELHESIEKLGGDKCSKILQNDKKSSKTKKITIAKSITNSSEDFEKSDFIIRTKTPQTKKCDFKEKDHNKNVTKLKPKRNNKQLTPKNINVKAIKINSEELFEAPEYKLVTKTQLENADLHVSSDDELNNYQTNISTSFNLNLNEQNLQCSSTLKRITRSQKNCSKSMHNSSKTKINLNDKSFKSFSQKKSMTKSINSISSDKSTTVELEHPISQKRMTRSKTTSTKNSVSFNIQNNNEIEFESKLFNITEQSNVQTPVNSKLQLKSIMHLNKYPENPILNSTTNSTIDQTSNDGMHFNPSTILNNNIKSLARADDWSDEFEGLDTKSSKKNKRSALNHNSTPFKKTKPHFNTQTILKDILEQSGDFDRFNCSQLAGLVVETVNQQNPDNNKDHIPADLLSDADDDWM